MNESIEELKSLAAKACIELYLSLHVSQMKNRTEQVNKAWSIGQELYFQSEDIKCNHKWVAVDNEAVVGGFVCVNCLNVKST